MDKPRAVLDTDVAIITPEDFIELLAASRDKGVEQHGP